MSSPESTWIGGDGGPLVILQASALHAWRGADDFDQSRMNGGTLETDYDAICECPDQHLHRHGRDMLILDDSEWSARILGLAEGVILVEQLYFEPETHLDPAERLSGVPPSKTFTIVVEDESLHLLVGADSGDGGRYGRSDVRVSPGKKRCDLYLFDDAFLLRIAPL